jgi:hypothetical protein
MTVRSYMECDGPDCPAKREIDRDPVILGDPTPVGWLRLMTAQGTFSPVFCSPSCAEEYLAAEKEKGETIAQAISRKIDDAGPTRARFLDGGGFV